jgi:uncharacterized protein
MSSILRRVIAPSVAVLFAYVLFAPVFQRQHRALGLALSQVLCFVCLPALIQTLSAKDAFAPLRLQHFQLRRVTWSALLGVSNFFAFVVPLNLFARALFPQHVLDASDSTKSFAALSPADLSVLLAVICLVAPVCEEYFYRGFLLPQLARSLSWPRALTSSALVFSVMHFNPVTALALFELGLLFAVVSRRGDNVWPAIAAHVANNLCAAGMYGFSRTPYAETFERGGTIAILTLSGLGAFLLLLKRSRSQEPVT